MNNIKAKEAERIIASKACLKEARAKLLPLMIDNESFDFSIEQQHYRCWRRPETTVRRPKINKELGTFTMQVVVLSPTIFIRRIGKRKEL